MSTSVPPVSTNAAGQPITGTSGTTIDNSSTQTIGTNEFLNLMMDQLTHQNPSQPTDPTQYLSELAQFTEVEQTTNMSQSTSQEATTAQVSQAVGMIGQTVSYTDQTTGATVSGTVQSVQITSSGPTVTVGGVPGIAPSSITQVS